MTDARLVPTDLRDFLPYLVAAFQKNLMRGRVNNQIIFRFPNGRIASIISGEMSYGKYELAEIVNAQINEQGEMVGGYFLNVWGYQSIETLREHMTEIMRKEQ